MLYSCVTMGPSVRGDGDVVKITREITDFSGVSAARGLEVYLIPDDKEYVIVEADKNLQPEIITEKKGDILHISTDNVIRSAKSKKIHVHFIRMEEIKSSSGAFIQSADFKTNNINLSASSGSRQEIEITAGNLTADLSSGASITLKGKAENATVDASSGARFKGDFKADTCTVDVSSGANISLEVITKLKANASSGGSINYRGTPTNTIVNSSSGGSIRTRE